MQFHYQDLYAALPGFVGTDAVRRAIAEDAALSPEGELPACPAPVMLRRRLTPLGKLVVSALHAVQVKDEEPFVVASSWGDSVRSMQLVQEMTESGDVSPAGFTSSVHNATSGAAGIWLKNHAACPAVSAGNFTTEAGLTECRLLLEEHESVVLVRAEAPLPDLWTHHPHDVEAPAYPYVWAMRLTQSEGARSFSITPNASPELASLPMLQAPEDLAFLLDDSRCWLHACDGRSWIWEK